MEQWEMNCPTISMNAFTSVTFFALVVILLPALAHFIFRRHEPTAFHYLVFQAVLFMPLVFLLQNSFFNGLLALSAFNFSLAIQIAFYRLFWHDLRSFPGPKLAALTQAWILREAYSGRTRFTMKELGERYGEWVRIGPNELYTTSIEALYTIMGAKGWPKGPSYDSGITKGDLGGDSVLTIKTLPEHATRRRIWNKAFTPKAIVEYLPSIENRLDEMISVIDDHVKQKKNVDLCLQLGCFVYDTMCDMAFGAPTGTGLLKNQKEKHRLLTHMGRVVRQVGIVRNMPWLTPLVKAWPSTQRKEQSEFRNFTRSMFLKRRNQGFGSQLDVFHYLLGEDTETGTRLNAAELAADSTLLVITGSDTTRTVFIAFFLYMLKHPGCMEELQAELMAAPDLSPPTLGQLPYLNACLQETMRLQPPSPANLQRMCPPGGAVICGRHIPEGTKVRFSNYAVQRDERYFDQPDEFRPQRWLKNPEKEKLGEGEGTERLNERAFFSFLIGPGACVAKNLAWMEMRLVVATLLTSYDVAFAKGFDPVAFESSWTDAYLLLIEEPFEVTFTPKAGRLR
ncbi:cytochrome P450 67 [Puccinia triticina 1-1 BBBD Race 1]|uniref:Cytochrome P450 67 n=1 Tax=Puccinia triticina (isolate 1-1 / race 1 (BBBD)) TaxID=630390 RepID=A0A180H4H9_PUCT1|nr:cytochrome P450 67 [Puccinia triticina 1-1 BBBD Race 1]